MDSTKIPKVPKIDGDDNYVDDELGPLVVTKLGSNPATKSNAVGLICRRLSEGRLALWQVRNLTGS